MERILIENFGGFKKIEFEFKKINILIGPQASGKSISVKLLYFFKTFTSEIIKSIQNGETKRTLDSNQKKRFRNYFPKESWPAGDFKISYTLNAETWITISRLNSLKFNYSENFVKLFSKGKQIFKEEQQKNSLEGRAFIANIMMRNRFNDLLKSEFSEALANQQHFIPAGRSFFAILQSSIFSILSNNKSLDPFLVEFGSIYEGFTRGFLNFLDSSKRSYKEFDKVINEIMNGAYVREKEKDYIVHKDKRKVNLSNASSGQQEILPLILVLKVLSAINENATLYIEEPEAHLFPTAQKKIVQLLARTFNSDGNYQIIITTHSPYILSSFNNLVEAGKIISEDAGKTSDVNKVIPAQEVLNPDDIAAYAIFDGKKKSLIDKETRLISQNLLDAVSNDISIDFGQLLDIEY